MQLDFLIKVFNMDIIVNTLISLSILGVILAIILYFVAQKFKVEEDPRIDEVEACLPGANCGGCGSPGCRAFAEACVKADNLDNLYCPAGGNAAMKNVAKILGFTASEKAAQIAVVLCNGSKQNRPQINNYDGPSSCAIATTLYGGNTACQYGCLGLGDCVGVCCFGAIQINEETGLPVVAEDKCGGCGACAKACPKSVIEIRNKGIKNRRIYVSCINKDKGGDAKKACAVACIACGKCAKACQFEAITVENFCAYIDFEKCKLCRKCVAECPTGAIQEINFTKSL